VGSADVVDEQMLPFLKSAFKMVFARLSINRVNDGLCRHQVISIRYDQEVEIVFFPLGIDKIKKGRILMQQTE
jgi:hypothetical protein